MHGVGVVGAVLSMGLRKQERQELLHRSGAFCAMHMVSGWVSVWWREGMRQPTQLRGRRAFPLATHSQCLTTLVLL